MICQKTWPPGGGAYFPYIIYIENFKNLLVRNHWTNFNITWQKCFLGDSLSRLFKQSWFVEKLGCYFPYIFIRKKLKIFLSETVGPFSILLDRNISLVTLYQDCSSCLDMTKNMAARGQSLFSLYIYIEKFKNLLVRNHWADFSIT